jgi:predicted transcriptional regulator
MGKTPLNVSSPPRLPAVRVSSDLLRRVVVAARALDQPMAAYVRMALLEKLDRDARASQR